MIIILFPTIVAIMDMMVHPLFWTKVWKPAYIVAIFNIECDNELAIDALYALAESTNVYTSEAYTTYKVWVDRLKESFDASTLVEIVENPKRQFGT